MFTSEKSLREDVVEAALRHAHVQRHLAAFEAIDLRAGTRLRTLHAASRRLAETGGRAAADLVLALVRAGIVADFVELHVYFRPFFHTSTRCWTARIMPRTEGVSSSVRVACILPSPSPRSVAAWIAGCGARAADLAHRDGFLRGRDFFSAMAQFPTPRACSPFWPSRREMISVTLRPRRWATMRGLLLICSASNIARTML